MNVQISLMLATCCLQLTQCIIIGAAPIFNMSPVCLIFVFQTFLASFVRFDKFIHIRMWLKMYYANRNDSMSLVKKNHRLKYTNVFTQFAFYYDWVNYFCAFCARCDQSKHSFMKHFICRMLHIYEFHSNLLNFFIVLAHIFSFSLSYSVIWFNGWDRL